MNPGELWYGVSSVSELRRTQRRCELSRVITYRPLFDELLPGRERGERRQELIPQLHTDRDVQVGLDPGHYQRL